MHEIKVATTMAAEEREVDVIQAYLCFERPLRLAQASGSQLVCRVDCRIVRPTNNRLILS